jgi:tRNA threonylcarbamoyladenosine biosynthesis protein TsaB
LEEVLLHIETSSAICSVALSAKGKLLTELVASESNRAGELIHVMINEVLKNAQIDFGRLQAVTISGGPGSYTGLRIGTAAAKGICFAANIPLIHIESLQAMQYAAKYRLGLDADIYIGMIDARRMDAFTAVIDRDGHYVSTPEAITLQPNSFSNYLRAHSCLIMGNAVPKFIQILPENTYQSVIINDLLASDGIALAYSKFQRKTFESLAYYEPRYYKAVFLPKN